MPKLILVFFGSGCEFGASVLEHFVPNARGGEGEGWKGMEHEAASSEECEGSRQDERKVLGAKLSTHFMLGASHSHVHFINFIRYASPSPSL